MNAIGSTVFGRGKTRDNQTVLVSTVQFKQSSVFCQNTNLKGKQLLLEVSQSKIEVLKISSKEKLGLKLKCHNKV